MQNSNMKQFFLVARIVAAACSVSIVLYYILVRLIGGNFKSTAEPMPEESLQIIRLVFLVICISMIAGSQLYKKMILSKKHPLKQEPGKMIFNFTVFSLFSAELPGLLGLILYTMERNLIHFYIAAAFSAALMIVFFPRYAKWEEWAKQLGPRLSQ